MPLREPALNRPGVLEALQARVNDTVLSPGERLGGAPARDAELDARFATLDAQLHRVEKAVAGLGGTCRALQDELEPQIRRVEQLDSRMWTWRSELEAETRDRLVAMEQQLSKKFQKGTTISCQAVDVYDRFSTNQASATDVENRLSRLEAAFDELLNSKLPELIAEARNAMVELGLDVSSQRDSDDTEICKFGAEREPDHVDRCADGEVSALDNRMAQLAEIALGSGVRAHAAAAAFLGALRDDVETAAALASEDEATLKARCEEIITRLDAVETRLEDHVEPGVTNLEHCCDLLGSGHEELRQRLDDIEPKVRRCWDEFFTNGSAPKRLSSFRTNGTISKTPFTTTYTEKPG